VSRVRRVAAVLLLSAAGAVCVVGVPPSPAAAVPAAALAAAPAAAWTAAGSAPVSVELDEAQPAERSVRIGERFRFTSTLHNTSGRPLTGLVAHLNVLGLNPDIYVDPEDWSTQRTQYLDPLPGNGSTRLTWDVQAVSTGRLALYVTVTPTEGADEVIASGPLRVTVAQQRMLNAGGVLPLAVGMPVTILLLMGVAIRRQRKLR
jgi:hypothetical protein